MLSKTVILEVTAGPHTGQTFTYDSPDSLLVGRSENAHLRLDGDPHISRNHCLIEVRPPQCHVVDLGSINGTFVNSSRISDCWLEDGDTIRGGKTQISVHLPRERCKLTETTIAPSAGLGTTYIGEKADGRIGDYRVLEEVGQGSMGVVHKAVHNDTGDVVAVKLLSPEMTMTDVLQQTFIREAGILCRLSHKRIVQFIEVGTHEGCLFMAMEFVDNVDVSEILDGLSLRKRIKVSCGLIRQILDGLQYAHDEGLVHRDIKPKNLLISRKGVRVDARLADFGLARSFAEVGMSQISSEHEIKGTLCFMAPEQIISSRNVKPAADIFSVGATLYNMISGKLIYDLSNHKLPISTILNDGPVPLEKRVPELPGAICRVIDKALAHDAADRYSSAASMRAMVTKVQALL